MRTASMVLGIIGGVFAIIAAIIFIIGGAAVSTVNNHIDDLMVDFDEMEVNVQDEDGNNVHVDLSGMDEDFKDMAITGTNMGLGIAKTMIWIGAIMSLIGAVLAIIGGAIVKKKNTLAGIFMIIAAVLCLFTGLGFISTIVLILGGIFALVKENRQQPAPPTAQ